VVLLGAGDFSIADSQKTEKSGATNIPGSSDIDPALLEQAIHLSAGYLKRNCDDKGKFTYRINTNPQVKPKPKYNVLRHAGAIYSLAMYAQFFYDKDTIDAIDRSVRFLMKESIAPIPGRDDLLAAWSYEKISRKKAPDQAKLGGTGLGLVALLSVEKIKPGTTSIDVLQKMGRFLIFMQKQDGSFYSKYIPAQGGKDDSWTSLYYPGEAALGLTMLYEKDPSPDWLQAAADAIAYLARIRSGRVVVEADHWALLATAKLLPIYERCRQPLPLKAILHHAVQICEGILLSKIRFPENSREYGCLTNDGRTVSTATRLEGLLAALTFLPKENVLLRKRITTAIHEGMVFLLRSQIRTGKYTGGFTRAVRPLPPEHPQYTKSFNKRSTEIRIDYVQHALSTMIQYAHFFHNQ
jgi:hypothetical protein